MEISSMDVDRDLYGVERRSTAKRCTRKAESEKTLVLKKISAAHMGIFFQNMQILQIPKHLTTLDEKYALRCYESIRNAAIRAAEWNFASKMDTLSSEVSKLALDWPLDGLDEWTVGSITRCQSMINILNSPLLQQFEALNSGKSFGKTNSLAIKPVYSSFAETSPNLSKKLGFIPPPKEAASIANREVSVPEYKRVASVSSTNSSNSDSSSSSCATIYQGMLHCTWRGGLLDYVFSVDDELLSAKMSKFESLDGDDWNTVYTFHSRKNSEDEDSEHVGKMIASKSMTSCSDIAELRFVLSVPNVLHSRERQTSTDTLNCKKKRFTRKMVDVFKSSQSNKKNISSKIEGTRINYMDSSNALEEASNLEVAAIVIKDIVSNNSKKPGLGGWGMKFLKKPENDPICTTKSPANIDVLVPAGCHSEPKSRNGGPSSLIERWMSGGQCDCGGWDIGCPLTILKPKSSKRESFSAHFGSEEQRSVDLFIQGSKEDEPAMKMVKIRKGLYYVHFQSTLSILQAFAICVAILQSVQPL